MVDDERLARKWLASLLQAHPDVSIVGEAATVPEAARLANALTPDLIFLDIQMPPENGFDLLPHLQSQPRIVFVTAHDSFAVRAFEAHALDYLLKPVRPERLADTLGRVRSLEMLPSIVPPEPPSPAVPERLMPDDLIPLRDGRLLRMIRVREIVFIEAEGAYTKIRIADQPPMILLRRLREWEALLPTPPFVRIGRSIMLNLARVRAIRSPNRDETQVDLCGSETLHLGRLPALRLRKVMQELGDRAAGF